MNKSLYFISIIPPTEVYEIIKSHQKVMSEQFNSHKAYKHKVHLTLIPPFFIDSSKEDKLRCLLKTYTDSIESFSIHLKNFSHFKKHTIYADVVKSDELYELKEGLLKLLNEDNDLLVKKINYFQKFNPHITIGYKDLESNFKDAWNHFGNQIITDKFDYQSITLLKRGVKKWVIIQ